MKVLVSGSHGLVGGHLLPSLKAEGHEVTRLIRRDFSERSRNVGWSPESGRIEKDRLRDIHAVVHLAGENIAGGRWNAGRKEGILQSRVKGTRLLAETLAAMHVPPKVMICASGVGYYGSRGDEILDEDSAAGPDSCRRSARPGRPRPNPPAAPASAWSTCGWAWCSAPSAACSAR
ncbi:MAG: NAD-dependent epimerase/dehydratase family protein [Kiritimatiellia bacterium]